MMHRLSGSSSDFCISGLTEDCHPASHFDLCSTHSNKFYASPTNPARLKKLEFGCDAAKTLDLSNCSISKKLDFPGSDVAPFPYAIMETRDLCEASSKVDEPSE
ncbi:hypothetical protein XENOCAPTIV_011998 [Xenoophorus captivus]|uniref:Uncharacterized protein n=1 Tax=Xenoophorus captivus TaxID=1517983 RepID=A0ABV0QIL3_9TELE